jgi:hypothetical protein
MLHLIYEGTPIGDIPVQAFNPTTPIYWEAGAIGMLDTNGKGVVSDGTTGAFGVLADRRSPNVGIAIINFLPSNPGGYGDESLFNQPGHGNSVYGTINGVNNVLPTNTVPTTTLLRDETFANPNLDSRFITMYTRGGNYATDQFDSTQTYVPGQTLYVMQDGTGRMTNVKPVSNSIAVAVAMAATDGYTFLKFKSTLL